MKEVRIFIIGCYLEAAFFLKQQELKKRLFKLLVIQLAVLLCAAQKNIVYQFDKCVIDSLKKGADTYSSLLHKPTGELKLFVLLNENNGEYNLYLQEYSKLPKSGFLQIIMSSNRKMRLSDKWLIPVVYPSDILCEQIQKDKIAAIPFSGYYLKVLTENYKQKVTEVAV